MYKAKDIEIVNGCCFPKHILSQHQKIPISNDNISKIMKTLIETLDVFHKYAEENDILYSLHGGSLMGYYWNKMMIPWDDDVDVIVRGNDIYKIDALWRSGTPIEHTKYENVSFNNSLTRVIKLNDIEYEIIKNVPKGIKTLFKLRPREHNCFNNVPGGVDIIYCMEFADGTLRDSWNPQRIAGGPANEYTDDMCPVVNFNGIKTRALINRLGEPYLDNVYTPKWRIQCHPVLK